MRRFLLSVVLLMLAGCGKTDQPGAPSAGSAAPAVTPGPPGAAASSAIPSSKPVETLEAAVSIPIYKGNGDAFAATPDGKRFVMAGRDDKDDYSKKLVRVYDLSENKVVREWTIIAGIVIPLAISPDGTRVIYGGLHGEKIADVQSGDELGALKSNRDSGVTAQTLKFTSDGKSIYGGCGKELVEFDASGLGKRGMKSGESLIEAISLFPDDSHVAVGYVNGGIRVFDLASGDARVLDPGSEAEPGPGDSAPNKVISLAASADGERLIIGRFDRELELWDIKKAQKLHGFPVRGVRSDAVTFAGNGHVVIGQGNWLTPDGKTDYGKKGSPLHAFDTGSGARIAYLSLPGSGTIFDGHVWNMLLSNDGQKLLVGVSNGTVQIFDISRWTRSGT